MKRIVLFVLFVLTIIPSCFAANTARDIYILARTNNSTELKYVENLDAVDSYGDTALCTAIRYNDVKAYNLLKNAGANTSPRCLNSIPANQYNSFMHNLATTTKSSGFLGLSNTAWAVIGVGAAAGAGAVALSGGGGSGSSSTSTNTGNNTTSCQTQGYTYRYSDPCPDGWVKNNNDYCNANNGTWFKCNVPRTCSAPYYTECANGYEAVPGDICLSGTTVYKHCIETTCPYTTTSCTGAYQETGNTCQSGNVLYKECEPIGCGAHETWSPSGCVCNNGWTGDNCDTPTTCPYTTTSCTGGYHATGNTCQSGDTLYRECEPNDCGVNATWTETGCICNDGYGNFHMGDGCIDLSNCGNHAYSDGHNCVCETGFTNWTRTNGCSPLETTLVIENTSSENDVVGLYNPRLASVGVFDYDIMHISNSTDSNVIGILTDDMDNAGIDGHDIEYGGKIYITNNGDGDVYGLKHINNFGGRKTSNSYEKENDRYANGKITINNSGDGNVYGIYNQTDSSYTNRDDLSTNLRVIYNDRTDPGGYFYSKATIDIHNTGNGNVYGMYGRTQHNVYITFPYTTYPSSFANKFLYTLGKINIVNEGTGNAYGMYTLADTTTSWYTSNAVHGTGNITVLNNSTGNAFGMLSETIPAFNARTDSPQVKTNGEINLLNNSTGNVYGMYGRYLYNAYAPGSSDLHNYANGTICITNEGNGNAYGMYSTGSIENASYYGNGLVKILNKGAGNAYGLFGLNLENASTSVVDHGIGTIELVNYDSGNVFAMYGNNAISNATNASVTSTINLQNLDTGAAIGLYASAGTVDNSGTININNTGTGTAIGIYGDTNSTISNSGTINITRNNYTDEDDVLHTPTGTAGDVFGIYAKSGSSVNNSGTINITSNGNTYGIYVESDSTVTNTGTISLNGVSCDGSTCDGSSTYNNHIVLNGGALYNSGLMMAPQMNLNSFGGNVTAGLGAQFIVENELSGNLNISSELVQNGNQTTYIAENMINAGDVSGLNVRSASAMFDASLADNGHDVVMQMKNFESLTDNKSLAAFLANNYTSGNGLDLFSTLKSMENMSAFNGALSGLTGLNTFTRFAHEDLSAMREISFSMNNKLFENSGQDSFDISDSLGYFSFSSNNNSGSGQYGISSDRISDNWKIGYGMATANINSRDGDGFSRQNNMWLFYVPATYSNNGYELVVASKAGFANSEYSRRGYNNINYEGYIEKRIFGLMNDLRYPLTFGNWTFAPDVAFNTIVYTQSGHEEEQEFSLVIPDDKTISIEAGLGLYTKYEKTFESGSRLKLNSGLMAYREFGDTYDIKLGIRGMDGTFSLYNNDYEYRGAASFGFDYIAGRLRLYGNAQYFMDNANYMNFKSGISYRF